MDIISAINIGIGFTQLMARSAEAASQINFIVASAQTENRELSDDDVKKITDLRKTATARWKDQAPNETPSGS